MGRTDPLDCNPRKAHAGKVRLLRQNDKTQVWSDQAKGPEEKILVDEDYKDWVLSETEQYDKFTAIVDEGMYVEGEGDPAATPNSERSSYLGVSYFDPYGNLLVHDEVYYTYVCAQHGDQPTPEKRDSLRGALPALVDCQWCIQEEADYYNCFGWSVGDLRWISYEEIDVYYGSEDTRGVFETADVIAFYDTVKGWSPINEGSDAEKAAAAEVMYYAYDAPWDYIYEPRPEGGGHVARKQDCICGAGLGWLMYTSKLGPNPRIEHRWEQVNCPDYGTPDVFFK